MRKSAKVYSIDGFVYKSNALVKLHQEFKANKFVKTFTLPQVKDKTSYNKYGAYKAEINGFIFDSIMEARYYLYLLEERANKKIKDFERQVKFNLLPKGRNKFKNKAILETNYIADFVIYHNNKATEVVDIKGRKTADFRIKEKMFMLKYPDLDFKCIQLDTKTNTWKDLDDIKKEKKKSKK